MITKEYLNSSYTKEKIFFPSRIADSGVLSTERSFVIYLPNLVMAIDPSENLINNLDRSNIKLPLINTIFFSQEMIIPTPNVMNKILQKSEQYSQIIFPHVPYQSLKEVLPSSSSTILSSEESTEILLKHGNYLCTIHYFSQNNISCGFTIEYKLEKISYLAGIHYANNVKTSRGIIELRESLYKGSFIHIVDYEINIKAAIIDTTILIVTVEEFDYSKNTINQLTVHDVIHMIKGTDIKLVIILPSIKLESMDKEKKKRIGKYITQETGIKAIMAYNKKHGLEVDL